ncbi:MAG: acyl--CoA ligase [Ectothiorhodospiraceae bacterium]|nr:acyl--CoA ligase [Ectothiorhodospiraceae bacterium]
MKPLLTLHNPAVATEYHASGYWRGDTFYSLMRRHATEQPDGWAVQDGSRRLSYAQLLAAVDQLASDLHELGVEPGDRVSVWLPNCVESVVIFLACSRNGYVANPSLHQNHTVAEIVRCLERLQTAVLFAKPGYGADATVNSVFDVAEELSFMRRAVALGDEGRGPHGLRFQAFGGTGDPARLPAADSNPDKITYLAFTSGTTGEPKGVMHSDNTLLANGRAMVQDWALDSSTVLYTLSPLSHHIGTVALSQAMVGGCELVINDIRRGQSPVDRIEETRATYVMGVPTHAMDILSELKRRNVDRLGCVKTFYMAGSPIPRSVAERFLELGIRPQNVYGMTENGSHQYTLPDDDVDTIVSTCGRACTGFEVAIFDAEAPDQRLGVGEVGEIGSRGALLMLGYYDNQFATERSFNRDGWFLSGDLGQLDEKGCLQIVGRKKDLIIRGGHNIHPTNIEGLAIRHPAANAVAAIPVADERLGEKVCLAVLPLDGQKVTSQEMLKFLHEQGLSKYDMPEYFIRLDEFPMTASGKILKRRLVDWVRDGTVRPEPVRWVSPKNRKETNNDG